MRFYWRAELEKTDHTQSSFLRRRHFRQLIPTVTRNRVTKDKSVKNNEGKLGPPYSHVFVLVIYFQYDLDRKMCSNSSYVIALSDFNFNLKVGIPFDFLDNLRSANYWKWQERVCRVTRDMAAPVSKCPGRPLCITYFSGPTWIKGVFPSHFRCGEK